MLNRLLIQYIDKKLLASQEEIAKINNVVEHDFCEIASQEGYKDFQNFIALRINDKKEVAGICREYRNLMMEVSNKIGAITPADLTGKYLDFYNEFNNHWILRHGMANSFFGD